MVVLCFGWTIICVTSKDGCGVALLNNTRHSPCELIILRKPSTFIIAYKKSKKKNLVTDTKLSQGLNINQPIGFIIADDYLLEREVGAGTVPLPTLAQFHLSYWHTSPICQCTHVHVHTHVTCVYMCIITCIVRIGNVHMHMHTCMNLVHYDLVLVDVNLEET